jgi:selenide,water dikinase
VRQGVATGASERNWKGYGQDVRFSGDEWKRKLLTDPQTSGGLLVACAPQAQDSVLKIFKQQKFAEAKVIGRLTAGPAHITVT